MTAEHRIVISPEAFGSNIDVVIEPPLPRRENLDRDFPTLEAARGYADGIGVTRGFPIVDMASTAGGAA